MGYRRPRYQDTDVDSTQVIISSHNSLGDGRYYDVESSSSFYFDHTKRVRTRSGLAVTTRCLIQPRKLVPCSLTSSRAPRQISCMIRPATPNRDSS